MNQKHSAKFSTSASETEDINFRSKYPAAYRTNDGHQVRSKAEQIIDNWLYNNEIIHAYERRVPIEEELVCDFFIPKAKVWIEYWGLEDDKYTERKKVKKELYRKYDKNLIELTDKDIENIDDILPNKLRPFFPSDFNFD